MPLLNVYKPMYMTPLQVIDAMRLKFPEYKDSKIGYAGRLDPLAHGVLLLMVGEEAKQREKYLDLPKTYEFEALFGLETDTYDLLGLVNNNTLTANSFQLKAVKTFISNKHGPQTQLYPPFSSKAVGGKPLHWWAKQNRLSEITIPTREITINSFELLATGTMTAEDLQKQITTIANTVQGHFRQKEILEQWDKKLSPFKSLPTGRQVNSQFMTARFRVSCSSGTYVRGLVHELGRFLGTGAVTTEIFRTEVGKYTLKNALRLPS